MLKPADVRCARLTVFEVSRLRGMQHFVVTLLCLLSCVVVGRTNEIEVRTCVRLADVDDTCRSGMSTWQRQYLASTTASKQTRLWMIAAARSAM